MQRDRQHVRRQIWGAHSYAQTTAKVAAAHQPPVPPALINRLLHMQSAALRCLLLLLNHRHCRTTSCATACLQEHTQR